MYSFFYPCFSFFSKKHGLVTRVVLIYDDEMVIVKYTTSMIIHARVCVCRVIYKYIKVIIMINDYNLIIEFILYIYIYIYVVYLYSHRIINFLFNTLYGKIENNEFSSKFCSK